MMKISIKPDPTLAAIDALYEAMPFEKRDYLGASYLGEDCARKVWYKYNGYPSLNKSANVRYAIEDGHRTEDLMADRLRMIEGVHLWTHDNNGKQFGFEDGALRGHCDGVIKGLLQAPKTPHIWEHKTKKQSEFNRLKKLILQHGEKAALKKWDETYYGQAQILMHGMKIKRHYLTVSLPGGRETISCRTNYELDEGLKLYDRAQKIIMAESEPPRISDCDTFFKCRLCDFRETCHT